MGAALISQNALELEAQAEAPEEQTTGGSSRFLLWLVAFSLGILFLPLYLISSTIQENTTPLRDELATLEAQLSSTPISDPETEALRAELMRINGQIGALEAVKGDLEANYVNWPAVMAIIASYDQNVMRLAALQQTDVHVMLNGAARDEGVITAYADMLRAADYFESVAVQSLNLRILPTPTPAPTATPLPADAAPVPPLEPASSSQAITREVEFTILMILKRGIDVESE